MNPAVIGALAQWLITGLPELINALNQAHPQAIPAPGLPPATEGSPTGWPPASHDSSLPHDGGDEGVRLIQTFLVALGAQIQADGFSGPATLAALNALAAKLKAAGGGLS